VRVAISRALSVLRTAPGRERANDFPWLVLVVSSRYDLVEQYAYCECAEYCTVLRTGYVLERAELVRIVRAVGYCCYFVEQRACYYHAKQYACCVWLMCVAGQELCSLCV